MTTTIISGAPTLRKLRLDVVLDCPLRCRHCSAFAAPGHPATFPPARARELVSEFATLGGEELTLTGGEPLASPRSVELLELAKSLGLKTALFSSGTLGDPTDISSVSAERLIALMPLMDRFVVTLYAARPALHDWVTGEVGSHARSLETVRRAIGAGITTELHFVPMHGTADELRGIASLARSMGAAGVRVIRFVEHGRAASEPGLRPSHAELSRLEVALRRLRDAGASIHVGSAFGFLVEFAPYCAAGIDELVVRWDGTVYPCSGFVGYEGPEAIGNVINDSLREVWLGSPLLKAMRSLMATRIAECTGERGCPAQKAAVAGMITDMISDPDALRPTARSGRIA